MANSSAPASPAVAPPPITGTHVPPHAHAASLGRALTASILVFLLATCALGVTAVMAPKFDEIFRDFGVALPYLTRVFLSLGHALTTPIGLVSAVAAVGLLCLAAGSLSYTRRWAFAIIIILALVGFVAYQGLFVFSLYGPHSALTKALEQNAPKP